MNRNTTIALVSYLILLIIAEGIISYYRELGLNSPNLGVLIHVSIILILLAYSFSPDRKHSLFMATLIFPPTIRILNTSLTDFEFIQSILTINSLIIVTAYLFLKNNKLNLKDAGFYAGNVKWQLCIGATGLLLGYVEYLILGKQMIGDLYFSGLIMYSLVFLFFTGFSEEFVFRGIILRNSENVISEKYALVFVSLIFTTMHIIWKNPLDIIFVFLVAMFYGYIFQRTGSLLGISLSHGIANIMLFLIIPSAV